MLPSGAQAYVRARTAQFYVCVAVWAKRLGPRVCARVHMRTCGTTRLLAVLGRCSMTRCTEGGAREPAAGGLTPRAESQCHGRARRFTDTPAGHVQGPFPALWCMCLGFRIIWGEGTARSGILMLPHLKVSMFQVPTFQRFKISTFQDVKIPTFQVVQHFKMSAFQDVSISRSSTCQDVNISKFSTFQDFNSSRFTLLWTISRFQQL